MAALQGSQDGYPTRKAGAGAPADRHWLLPTSLRQHSGWIRPGGRTSEATAPSRSAPRCRQTRTRAKADVLTSFGDDQVVAVVDLNGGFGTMVDIEQRRRRLRQDDGSHALDSRRSERGLHGNVSIESPSAGQGGGLPRHGSRASWILMARATCWRSEWDSSPSRSASRRLLTVASWSAIAFRCSPVTST